MFHDIRIVVAIFFSIFLFAVPAEAQSTKIYNIVHLAGFSASCKASTFREMVKTEGSHLDQLYFYWRAQFLSASKALKLSNAAKNNLAFSADQSAHNRSLNEHSAFLKNCTKIAITNIEKRRRPLHGTIAIASGN
ncbi:MAG: hypothetical protein ACR2OR_08930 [Hyphomicrobiales bacterium]